MTALSCSDSARQEGRSLACIAAVVLVVVCFPWRCGAFEAFDLVSGVLDAPQFSGKEPLQRLRLAAELMRSDKVKASDLSFVLLDWGDQYLREPADLSERLQRWAQLNTDESLSKLKIPRDFLNRMVLAEFLVHKTPYLKASARKKLEILAKLENKKLVEWSVWLAYARLYAGTIISGAKGFDNPAPAEALSALKKLEDESLVGWHYRVPTEAILVAEVLALDKAYQKAGPQERLAKLRDLERKGLIGSTTRKELEKLPAWRLLVSDPSFLKADPGAKREWLTKLRDEELISASIFSDLTGIFRPMPSTPLVQATPVPIPKKVTPNDRALEPSEPIRKP